jgi:hypothetical protein
MLTRDFMNWLGEQPLDGQEMPVIYQGPVGPPSEPRKYLVVTPVGGGSMQVDGHIEARAFQVKVVGRMGLSAATWNDVFAETEQLARDIDKVIITAGRPVIGGEQVVYISRFGSTPQGSPAGQPLDSANRPSFQAMYVVEAESSIYES